MLPPSSPLRSKGRKGNGLQDGQRGLLSKVTRLRPGSQRSGNRGEHPGRNDSPRFSGWPGLPRPSRGPLVLAPSTRAGTGGRVEPRENTGMWVSGLPPGAAQGLSPRCGASTLWTWMPPHWATQPTQPQTNANPGLTLAQDKPLEAPISESTVSDWARWGQGGTEEREDDVGLCESRPFHLKDCTSF